MTDTSQVRALLFAAVDDTNRVLPPERQLEPSLDTILFGIGGRLDSIGLVTLVLTVEEHLSATLENPISLSDDRAMSQRHSPFRTLGTLEAYIVSRLQEQRAIPGSRPVDGE